MTTLEMLNTELTPPRSRSVTQILDKYKWHLTNKEKEIEESYKTLNDV